MKVAFIQNIWEEIHGPLILAELLKREGHEVRFFLEERGWLKKIAGWAPDLVGISVVSSDYKWALQAARLIKETFPDPPIIVLGGPHPTFFPESIESPWVDAICRGEGETAFPIFLKGIEGKRLPVDTQNFWVKQDGRIYRNELGPLADLDSLPIPGRELYRDYPFLKNAPNKRTITSRGCPYNCTYCFNHVYREMVKGRGPYLRRRSVAHVIAELEYLKKTAGFKNIEFFDDIFTLDEEWVLEFCAEFKKRINTPYCVASHVAFMNDKIARALAESGCTRVMFGIESGSPRIREEIMNKKIKNEDIRKCADDLRRHGVPFMTFNMVGLPGETLEDAFLTVRFNQEIKPIYAWCSIAQPYPGTRLAKICEEQKLLPPNINLGEAMEGSVFGASILRQKDGRALVNLHKFFGLLVRFPWSEPLVRLLIRLPPNYLFKLAHQLYYGYHMKLRNKLSWPYALKLYFRYQSRY